MPMTIEPVAADTLAGQPDEPEKPQIRERTWGIEARADATVSYPEFAYWAKVERAEEVEEERKYREIMGPWTFKKMIKSRFSKGAHHEKKKHEERARREAIRAGHITTDEKGEKGGDQHVETTNDSASASSSAVSDEEWKTAARALRTASWGSVFYLITTDVLGWSSCP